MNKTANRNTFWAYTLVEELQRAGLEHVVISPGSRSTPLALAFAQQPGLSVVVHPDERGAAFLALGIGLASGRPAAVLCTSGTAAANLFPAIVEAHQSNVPMLVLTADRPAELRDSGANQTIDQVKLYGGYVRWAGEVPQPEKDPADLTVRALRSLAGRALAATQGLKPGPVHLNVPFRKPLEPTPVPGDIPARLAADPTEYNREPERNFRITLPAAAPFVRIERGKATASVAQIDYLVAALKSARRGLICCGPRCPDGDFPQAVYHLAQFTGFPILIDPLSGLRFHADLPEETLALGGYDTFLKSAALKVIDPPDLLLQFGGMPISASLIDYLGRLPRKNSSPPTRRIQIDGAGNWADEAFNTSDCLWADPESTIRAVLVRLGEERGPFVDINWQSAWQRAERLTWQIVDQACQGGFFEGSLLADILDELQDGDNLFLASSLPVRHLDQFGRPQRKSVKVFANRGASGIDGTIASAMGVALSMAATNPGSRLVLAIGDLAFFHDINSLLLLHRYPLNVTIVLINNNGGGIFQRLPIAAYEPYFSQLFLIPHGLEFEHAARLFQLVYRHIGSGGEFRLALKEALASSNPHANAQPQIIEVATDIAENEKIRRSLLEGFELQWSEAAECTG